MSRRDIVVVGASAGGVRALCSLVAQLPAGFPAAVCVVLHVGARPSNLPDLLGASGPLPAEHAESGERLQPGRVYVAPPDHHLMLSDSTLVLTRGPREHHTRPAVDPLFRSAALSEGPRVIGVLLTGRLDDGTAGLQAIKECGGVAVVQEPSDAEEPSMPMSALQTVAVDHCVPLQRMGELLVQLVQQPAPALPATPPARLVHEHASGFGGENVMEEMRAMGSPSTLVCPDCKGSLWEVTGSRPPRYRCHTGHAYSLRSLAATQAEKTEDALWSAIRALHEKELLLRKVAALDRSVGDDEHAARTEEEAEEIAAQMEALRRLVQAA
jgi:two-component system, chemotaxis family, protein-glutamate methylesterase/glutaminase